jgi:Rrf2 family protein
VEITRRTDYAIRMMTALAGAGAACPVSVRALAEAQGVPYAFARTVQRDLMAAGLVVATRGAAGGLCLTRPAADITLLEIVGATQGVPSIATCSADPTWCGRSGSCSAHHVWCEIDALVREQLGNKTLEGLTSTRGE